jgi:hypothetical protein
VLDLTAVICLLCFAASSPPSASTSADQNFTFPKLHADTDSL